MTKMNKIIFTGPVGAGKTTSIASVSDIEPFVTEEAATDETAMRKDNTTVAMDYGMIKLDQENVVHLYGTPGQERFNFMWDLLTDGGIGLVVLLDNKRPDPFEDLKFFLEAFSDFIDETQVVVGVTRMDLQPLPGLNRYHEWMRENGYNIPIFEVDGRNSSDIAILIQTLLYCLDPGLSEAS